MTAIASPHDIVAFWQAAGYDKWFNHDEDFDAEIRARFLTTYENAAAGELSAWQREPEGALALTLALDQFPRNLFRGDPRTYATDAQARAITRQAIARGFDRQVPAELRSFFYLPLMHSEDPGDQDECVALYRAMGDANYLKYAEHHAEIVRRFGRFPHRNAILGRETTPQEQAFLDSGGFKG